MAIYGADPQQLRDLGRKMSSAAQNLEFKATKLQSELSTSAWKGPDAQRFRSEWNSTHRPALSKVIAELRSNAKDLLRNAQEQEHASAADGGGTIGGVLASSITDTSGNQVLNQLQADLDKAVQGTPEEQKAWWDSLSEEQRQAILSDTDSAVKIMQMDGGVPAAAQEVARAFLSEQGKSSVPVMSVSGSAAVDAQVAWVHGGARVSAAIIEFADGSAKMTVAGALSGGVNTPSPPQLPGVPSPTASASATASAEQSITYTFASMAEAQAAREQMFSDLPPNNFSKVVNVSTDPAGYILDTVENSAQSHHMINRETSFTLGLDLSAEADATDSVSVEGSLGGSWEKNQTTGESTITATASMSGTYSVAGEEVKGNGSGTFALNFDKNDELTSLSITGQGTATQTAVTASPDVLDANGAAVATEKGKDGLGGQVTWQMNVAVTPETSPLIESYVNNMRTGNFDGADADYQQLYDAATVTEQFNAVTSSSTEEGMKLGPVQVKLTLKGETSTNISTSQKLPYDDSFISY